MNNGIRSLTARHTVDELVERLTALLAEKTIKLFAIIDHAGEAATVGLHMPATKLLIFGSPKAGTPLMLAAPSCALDLPLKILVAEDAQGRVWLSYNSTQYLKQRYGLPEDLVKNISGIAALADNARK